MKIITTKKIDSFYLKENQSKKEFRPQETYFLFLNFKEKLLSFFLSVLLLTLFFSSTASAHRGAKNEVDTCRLLVGSEVVHFSAYTPTLDPEKSYCHDIPEIGLTHLVIDYEGKKLRQTTVEFEVTKEPEGTRIYYQEPQKIKKGSLEAKINFKDFGAGEYLTHITIVHQGEKLDTHLPFSVGIERDSIPYRIIIPIILVIITWIGVQIKVKERDYSGDDHIAS